jgi:methanogenic corrinoid protein MtbC1
MSDTAQKNEHPSGTERIQLPPMSPSALARFNHDFPKILELVREKYDLEMKYLGQNIPREQQRLAEEVHRQFGDLLRASYEFNLYDHLQDEFCWYISVFCSRGFVIDYLEHLLRSWDMAIHSVIKPPESHELTRPLEALHQHLNSLYKACSIERVTMPALIQPFMDHLLAKRRKEATEYILSLLSGGMSIERLYADILTASLTTLGRLWQKNDINVVDVHVATDICRYVMMRLADALPAAATLPYKALITCVPGEEHEMGAEILENYLEIKGWKVVSMGHIAPEEDILDTIQQSRPDVVLLSVILIAHLPAAKSLLQHIREVAPGCKIVVGGPAAVLAGDTLGSFANAVVTTFEEAHTRSLQLLGSHA